jgi:ribosome biogenesis protein YTM1
VFASASHDQTVNIFQWNSGSNSVEGVNTCRGHERSVECLAVQRGGRLLASGSFDNTVKVWGARVVGEDPVPEGGSEAKRSKSGGDRSVTRTPLSTLGGHKEAVAGVQWLGEGELASASWDHTIKIWDTEMGGLKSEMVGNKAFFSLSYSTENRTLLATGADRSVRLYDPRSTEGSLVKAMYTSHVGWVSAVHWAEKQSNLFVSSAHDHLVKMWDQRSYKTPLYELTGHSDKVLSCDWSSQDVIASGGADNDMKIFKSKVPGTEP